MRLRPVSAALAALLLAAPLTLPSPPAGREGRVRGAALDFDKVDRRIAREPAYRDKPLYGLALLGPDGKARVWMALDGERLYVDRNCNGDLTDDGPPAELKDKASDPAGFEIIDVSPDGGRTVYKFDVALWGRPSLRPGGREPRRAVQPERPRHLPRRPVVRRLGRPPEPVAVRRGGEGRPGPALRRAAADGL
jgi:hypothetical protein